MDLNDIGVRLFVACFVLVVNVKVSVGCAVLVGSTDDVKPSVRYVVLVGSVDDEKLSVKCAVLVGPVGVVEVVKLLVVVECAALVNVVDKVRTERKSLV